MLRRTAAVLTAVLVAGLLVVSEGGRTENAQVGAAAPAGPAPYGLPRTDRDRPPDVVLVLTDDQRPDTVRWMPTVTRQIRDKGTRFTRVVASTPTCCPSRASIVTGRYARDTGVYGNTAPNGGWRTSWPTATSSTPSRPPCRRRATAPAWSAST